MYRDNNKPITAHFTPNLHFCGQSFELHSVLGVFQTCDHSGCIMSGCVLEPTSVSLQQGRAVGGSYTPTHCCSWSLRPQTFWSPCCRPVQKPACYQLPLRQAVDPEHSSELRAAPMCPEQGIGLCTIVAAVAGQPSAAVLPHRPPP